MNFVLYFKIDFLTVKTDWYKFNESCNYVFNILNVIVLHYTIIKHFLTRRYV